MLSNNPYPDRPTPYPKPVRVFRPKKRKKKTSRQLLEKQADALVREIVLKRDGFCVCPPPKKGHSDILQCGHLITRGKESVKWDLYNCNAQCSSCNGRHEHYWHYYEDWFLLEFGKEERLRISKDSDAGRKLSPYELEKLCGELTAIKMRQEVDKNFKPRFSQSEILSGSWRRHE